MKYRFCFHLLLMLLIAPFAKSQDSARKQKDTVLPDVLVTARKKPIEIKIDRTIVNIDALISTAGGNALEALAKSPGVLVDVNGNIRLNGSGSVLVLINDRPLYMSAQDLSEYLRSLPAGLLDRIELMSNPPSRYEASGNAIINLILKKNHAAGFNNQLNIGLAQGIYANPNISDNINLKKEKINIFANLGYSSNRNYTNTLYDRYFYNTNEILSSALLVKERYTSPTHALNSMTGMDYFLNAKTTVGIMLTGGLRPKSDHTSYNSLGYDAAMNEDTITNGYTNGQYNWKNYGINLNLQHKLNQTGTILTMDIDHLGYYTKTTQKSYYHASLPDGTLTQSDTLLFYLPARTNINSIKTDFTHPINKTYKIEAGLKSSFVQNENQSEDHFFYQENINALYITGEKEEKKWGAKAGIRAENTNSSSFHYHSLFPSLYLQYKIDKTGDQTLSFSYGRRINRPNYQQLNPYIIYHDQYTYSTGNPSLKPGYRSFYELKYRCKGSLGLTLSYGNETNVIYPITETNGNIFVTRPENFATRQSAGILPDLSIQPTPFWNLQFNAVLIYFFNHGSGYGITLNQNTNIHEFQLSNQLHFKNGWSAELNGFFPGRQTFGQSQGGAIYNIYGGIQKNLLNDRATLRLKIDDLFHTMKTSSHTIGFQQISAYQSNESDTRKIGISFSYRMGKATNARKRNHTSGGAEEEQKRTN